MNKWIRGAIPALCIHCCIGSVYCWSLLKDNIAAAMQTDVPSIELAFSLAIFFLGMSAAFGGRMVEKNVKLSSFISCLCFSTGLIGSIYAIHVQSIPLLFTFYGAVMGVGLGIGYLSPVKTLMLWFSEHKGLATGIAISGFGLSKAIFSPYIEWCNVAHGIDITLGSMAVISLILMSIAVFLIKKPDGWVESNNFKVMDAVKVLFNPSYLMIWVVFYLNITCGLALIAFEKSLAGAVGIGSIGLLAAVTAGFNTLGRFGYSSCSDFLKNKPIIYLIIFVSSLAVCFWNSVSPIGMIGVICGLCIINAGYGGGFSTLPILLQNRFGMGSISMIHGFALSAWAWAGLSGNQLSSLVLNYYGGSFNDLFLILGCLYTISALITCVLVHEGRQNLNIEIKQK